MKLVIGLVLLSITLGVVNGEVSFTFFDKQEAVLESFQHVFQKNLFNIDLHKEAVNFTFDATKYEDPHVFNNFLSEYHRTDQTKEFSISNVEQRHAFVALYKLFMGAKDLFTLYQTIAWARYNVNPYMYIYSLIIAIEHRLDTKDVLLPAIYEINPFFFFNSRVIEEALTHQMQGYEGVTKENGVYTVVIPANYSTSYGHYNEESTLNYFTEDIGINEAFFKIHSLYPHWKGDNKFRIQVILKNAQHILSRYYLERLSNNLGEIPQISWIKDVETGYMPDIHFHSGVQFPSRSDYYNIYNKHTYELVDYLRNLESSISIDYTNLPMEKLEFVFRKYVEITRKLLTPSNKVPGVLFYYETMLRDPTFFQITKRMLNLIPPTNAHKFEDISFVGVKINSVEMDKLVTYFDYFDADITNAVDVNGLFDRKTAKSTIVQSGRVAQYNGEPVIIKAQQLRLNHVAFSYKIHIHSDKVQQAKLKMFLGPKYDENGRLLTLKENYQNFFELDIMKIDLKEGDNIIQRSCKDFPYYTQDHTTYYNLYKNLELARKGEYKYPVKKEIGYPWRTMLPKGKKEGFPVQFFYFISPVTEVDTEDLRWLSYPLDREIDENVWYTPNMYYYDTLIYHKKESH